MVEVIQAIITGILVIASMLAGGVGIYGILSAPFRSPYNSSVGMEPIYAVAWLLVALLCATWARLLD